MSVPRILAEGTANPSNRFAQAEALAGRATLLMAAIGDLIPSRDLNPLSPMARLLGQWEPPGTSLGQGR